jgi:hypothetical protein
MNQQPEREAVIIRGVLDRGASLEWRPGEAETIYVGSDPRCQWRLDSAELSPFHWHLCWYGSRLWMADLSDGHGGNSPPARGSYQWSMAPIGAVLRLGSAVMVFEMGAAERASPYGARRARPDDPTMIMGAATPPRGTGFDRDPDATQLLAPDDLRALAPFGPSSRATGAQQAMAPPADMPPPGTPALEEMFIIPAEKPAPPPKGPSPLARLTAAVPPKILLSVLAAGALAALTFLPERLHADHEQAAPASLPARRPPPEVRVDMRAVQPDAERAELESAAARDLASGRLEEALSNYRKLAEAAPDDPVYRDFAAVLERRVKSRCPEGDCVEEEQ